MAKNKIYLVIPTYEPDHKLIELVKEAYQTHLFDIIVINDGSNHEYDSIFDKVSKYATVLTYSTNKGKGIALKTAYRYISTLDAGIIVTADSDGQHHIDDIINICDYSVKHPDTLVLGKRTFKGHVPLKSCLGNTITRYVFYITNNQKIYDTQTGLRAFSSDYLDFMLKVDGNRFEYEMNVLVNWSHMRPIVEIPIQTIYFNNNQSTHFRPLQDGYLIYKDLLKFGGSSFLSFIIDYSLYTLFIMILSISMYARIILANTIARIMSASFNYTMNRRFVFNSHENILKSSIQYFILALAIYFFSTTLITFIYHMTHMNLLIIKLFVDTSLFICSYTIQLKIKQESPPQVKLKFFYFL